jgi:hypothetical protein
MTPDNPNPATTSDEPVEADHPYGERTGPRVVIDEITGYPVVTARPGAPLVTNEDVKRELEDFP